MPTVITQGAASAKGYGFGARSVAATYIEDVFSTYLYTGTGASQTITNGIDLSGKGGLVWMKGRSGATAHALYDTARGATFDLVSSTTAAQTTQSTGLTAFGSTGFTIGALAKINTSSATYVSWSFRKQAKFFDIVTYTGDGANRTIAHNLGSVPGCIMIKRTDTTGAWAVYHRSLANTQYTVLNTTAAAATGATYWNSTTPTSSVFSLGTATDVNASGGTYVAYLFAHDAGGFGASGSDNVISCGEVGTFGNSVNLGYEPQWLLFKRTDSTSDWYIYDAMRGFTYTFNGEFSLSSNVSSAEVQNGYFEPITNGFQKNLTGTWIYIAIRRGPMKTPTTGTSVFSPITFAGGTTSATTNFPVDLAFTTRRNGIEFKFFQDRLIGGGNALTSTGTDAEFSVVGSGKQVTFASNTGVTIGNSYSGTAVLEAFRRAPGFFDEVCYTGTGSALTVNHNLGVTPEFWITKKRSAAQNWFCGGGVLGNATTDWVYLNTTNAKQSSANIWLSPTATTFGPGSGLPGELSASGATYVAYLFATVAGVSKVGSYTGTGTTQQINCGFTTSARFVLIKRTDSTGDWYVWDSARGIVAGNDSYLLLNSTAAEVTNTDYIDTYSAGFEISSTAPAAINANGGSFIFLAVA